MGLIRTFAFHRSAALVVAIVIGAGLAPAAPGALSPFEDARFAPADVDLYVHVDGARGLRRDVTHRPLQRLVERLLAQGELRAAWARLAAASGLDGTALFDLWLGGHFTLVRRHEEGATDWALWTDLRADADADRAAALLERLGAHRRAPRGDVALAELPDHGLRVARRGTVFVIGPNTGGRLLTEVLRRQQGGAVEGAASLVEQEGFDDARRLGAGSLALFVRHAPPLGGWSSLIARVEGDHVRIRHLGRYESPPFGRPVTATAIDTAPLTAFESEALLAVIEPTDIGGGPAEAFAEAWLGVPLLSPALRTNLGPRRILALGETEGRLAPDPTDLLLPTGAIAIEVRDPRGAEAQLDAHMLTLARALGAAAPTGAAVEIPDPARFTPGAPRHVDVRPVLRAFAGDLPLLGTATLNWTVARSPHGSYCVLATHPEHLAATVRALTAGGEAGAAPAPAGDHLTSCGTIDGRRLGVHLRTYADGAASIAPDEPGAAEELRETMLLLSALADGVERCRWRLCRPTATSVRLDVELILSPPESSAGHPAP